MNRPARLVYTESLFDESHVHISPASAGMPKGNPDVTEVFTELSEAASETRMVMMHVGVPEGSAGNGGRRQAFDKLDALVRG